MIFEKCTTCRTSKAIWFRCDFLLFKDGIEDDDQGLGY